MTPPPSNLRENDVFVNVKLSDIDTGKILVDCICNMAKAGPNPETFLQASENIKKIGWEETWKKQPQVVIIPNNMKGFWGEKAINDCEKLISLAPVELNLVDMRRDFPVMNNNASRTETIYNNPPNQIFWDFSPTTVSLLVDRRKFIVFFFPSFFSPILSVLLLIYMERLVLANKQTNTRAYIYTILYTQTPYIDLEDSSLLSELMKTSTKNT